MTLFCVDWNYYDADLIRRPKIRSYQKVFSAFGKVLVKPHNIRWSWCLLTGDFILFDKKDTFKTLREARNYCIKKENNYYYYDGED